MNLKNIFRNMSSWPYAILTGGGLNDRTYTSRATRRLTRENPVKETLLSTLEVWQDEYNPDGNGYYFTRSGFQTPGIESICLNIITLSAHEDKWKGYNSGLTLDEYDTIRGKNTNLELNDYGKTIAASLKLGIIDLQERARKVYFVPTERFINIVREQAEYFDTLANSP